VKNQSKHNDKPIDYNEKIPMKNVHSFLLEGSNKFFGDGCILVYNFQAKML